MPRASEKRLKGQKRDQMTLKSLFRRGPGGKKREIQVARPRNWQRENGHWPGARKRNRVQTEQKVNEKAGTLITTDGRQNGGEKGECGEEEGLEPVWQAKPRGKEGSNSPLLWSPRKGA